MCLSKLPTGRRRHSGGHGYNQKVASCPSSSSHPDILSYSLILLLLLLLQLVLTPMLMPLPFSSRSSRERTSRKSLLRDVRSSPLSQLEEPSLLPVELLLLPEVMLQLLRKRLRKRKTRIWDSLSSIK